MLCLHVTTAETQMKGLAAKRFTAALGKVFFTCRRSQATNY